MHCPPLALDRAPAMPPGRGPVPARTRLVGARHVWLLRGPRDGHRDLDLLLADAGRFTGEMTEVVELGATHAPAAHNRKVRDHGAVDGEDALDADAIGDLAHGERLAD